MSSVTIGGELRTLQDFSGFKAQYAMDLIASVEETVRGLVCASADFRADYTARTVKARSVMELTRVEARRMFAPEPLYEQQPGEPGGDPVLKIVLQDGQPVMRDPLGHLTDADWEACDNVLRIPTIPAGEDDGIDNAVMMALVPRAFKDARGVVLQLVALVTVSNRDLEDWDTAGADIDAELTKKAREITHRASAAELIGLAVAAIELARDQVAGPFKQAMTAMQGLFADPTPDSGGTSAPAQQPMTLDTEPAAATTSSPASSTPSPAGTAGSPSSVFTEPAGVSS